MCVGTHNYERYVAQRPLHCAHPPTLNELRSFQEKSQHTVPLTNANTHTDEYSNFTYAYDCRRRIREALAYNAMYSKLPAMEKIELQIGNFLLGKHLRVYCTWHVRAHYISINVLKEWELQHLFIIFSFWFEASDLRSPK